ncbi:MAG: response regulator [Desulfobacterales bacterium]|jgi:DNA-binding NtrC family response regulator|nr:response regulator [Desulfobacterales bacterium]
MANVNVLLVDDETTFVNVMEKRLKKRQVHVVTAFSGPEALQKLAENSTIEVVILDVKMPLMDGIETLSRIKKEHPLVEVIMLTAHATVESAIDGMKLGAFDYLMKPCEVEELIEKAETAAQQKRAQEEKIIEARMREITLRRA